LCSSDSEYRTIPFAEENKEDQYDEETNPVSEEENSDNLDKIVEGLNKFFAEDKESVNIEDVKEFLEKHRLKPADWEKFATWDKYRYTRNLMNVGNGNFNLILMCWPEGTASPIHDHADSHCFLTVLQGGAREVKYYWPEDKSTPTGSLVEMERSEAKAGDVLYMADELGLHRIENSSHTDKLISMHCYSPPFDMCQVFDQRTAKTAKAKMRFWTKFGKKVEM